MKIKEKKRREEKSREKKKRRRKRKKEASDPYRLSHFVAPLYVAPSPTPSNAKPTSRVFVRILRLN